MKFSVVRIRNAQDDHVLTFLWSGDEGKIHITQTGVYGPNRHIFTHHNNPLIHAPQRTLVHALQRTNVHAPQRTHVYAPQGTHAHTPQRAHVHAAGNPHIYALQHTVRTELALKLVQEAG